LAPPALKQAATAEGPPARLVADEPPTGPLADADDVGDVVDALTVTVLVEPVTVRVVEPPHPPRSMVAQSTTMRPSCLIPASRPCRSLRVEVMPSVRSRVAYNVRIAFARAPIGARKHGRHGGALQDRVEPVRTGRPRLRRASRSPLNNAHGVDVRRLHEHGWSPVDPGMRQRPVTVLRASSLRMAKA
jgi:hypothetical protein